jgi:hypothetical protein
VSKTIADHLEAIENTAIKVEDHPLPNLKPLFNTIAARIPIDSLVCEDLIHLAHGNQGKEYFLNLANRYSMPPKIIDTFFLSSKPLAFL